jgi:O-antigen/teichoic acid export membrane protein
MLGAAAIAEPLFFLLLGEAWLPAVLIFQILTLAMMLYPIHAFNLNILQVYGRSDLFLKLEVIKKIIITIAVIVAFQFGLMGLVWSSVFTSFAGLGVNMFYSSKLINYSIHKQISDLGVTFFLAFISAMSMFVITLALVKIIMILQIIISSLVGCLVYMGLNYCIANSPLHEALQLFKYRNQ